jgi:ATP-binding cassette subfamily C (CFTR/MRP) protein 1
MQHNNPVDPNLDVAVQVTNATFKWASSDPDGVDAKKATEEKARSSEDTLVGPFMISALNMSIPRGKLVGIVGPVGSGKSSLLQGVSTTVTSLIIDSSSEK